MQGSMKSSSGLHQQINRQLQPQSSQSKHSRVDLQQSLIQDLLPEQIHYQIGTIFMIQKRTEVQAICLGLKVVESLIIAPSIVNTNTKDAKFYFQFGIKKNESNCLQQSICFQIKQWVFLGQLKQQKTSSAFLAIGLLDRRQPFSENFQISQALQKARIGQVIRISNSNPVLQSACRSTSLQQSNELITNLSAIIVQISSYFIQYQIDSVRRLDLKAGTPIQYLSAEGLKLLGLHLGHSASSQQAYFGIKLSPFHFALQKLIQKMRVKSDLSLRQILIDHEINHALGLHKSQLRFGRYLFRKIKVKKVEVFNDMQKLVIRLQDSNKHTLVYSQVTQQHLNSSKQFINDLNRFNNMLEQELQNQSQTLDHIFRKDDCGLLEVKLNNEPLIASKIQAKFSTFGLKYKDILNLPVDKAKQEINRFIRDRLNEFIQMARVLEERLSLKFKKCQDQIQRILEKTKKRVETSVSSKIDAIVAQAIDSIKKQIQANLNLYKVKEDREQNIIDIKQKVSQLTQLLSKQKQEIRQVGLSILQVERKGQISLKQINIRLDSQSFINQTNFLRFEQIHNTLNQRLKTIEEELYTIKRENCQATNYTIMVECAQISRPESFHKMENQQSQKRRDVISRDRDAVG